MSTRSMIARQNADNTVTAIYCHFDGYPEGAGRTLADHYATREKVDALLALGDLSVLDAAPAPPDGAPHSYDGPRAKGVCVAYGRDRGEEGVEAKTYPAMDDAAFKELARGNYGAEYLYLWRDGRWDARALYGSETFAPLAEMLAKPAADDEAAA